MVCQKCKIIFGNAQFSKIEIAIFYLSLLLFFIALQQFCIGFVDWFMVIFLYSSLYSYCSFNYIAIIGIAITIEREIMEIWKEILAKIKQRKIKINNKEQQRILIPLFLGGMRKGEKNNQSCGQKSFLSARSKEEGKGSILCERSAKFCIMI